MKILSTTLFILGFSLYAYTQSWMPLSSGCGYSTGNAVYSLDTFQGRLIAGGRLNVAGGTSVDNITAWNGSTWEVIASGGVGQSNGSGEVYSMAVYNGELYVGGVFTHADAAPAISVARWDGTTWSSVGSGINLSGYVGSMCVYNNELYVAGSLDSAGGIPVNNIAKWNGTSWSAVGTGLSVTTSIYDLTVYNGKLYAAGGYPESTNAGLYSWDGSSWAAVSGGLNFAYDYNTISSMTIYNGNLYASAIFDTVGGQLSVGLLQWNGTAWSTVPSINQSTSVGMTVFNDSLIMINPVNSGNDFNVIESNGSTWTNVGTELNGEMLALFAWNNNLYVAGMFTDQNGSPDIINIAQYSTSTGIIPIGSNSKINIYSNPVSDKLNIANIEPNASIIITNLLGQEMIRQTAETSHVSVDVSALSAGIYFMNNMKFIKE